MIVIGKVSRALLAMNHIADASSNEISQKNALSFTYKKTTRSSQPSTLKLLPVHLRYITQHRVFLNLSSKGVFVVVPRDHENDELGIGRDAPEEDGKGGSIGCESAPKECCEGHLWCLGAVRRLVGDKAKMGGMERCRFVFRGRESNKKLKALLHMDKFSSG